MNMKTRVVAGTALALAFGLSLAVQAGEWSRKSLKDEAPDAEITTEETKLKGKIVGREEKDEGGNKITSAFLEREDGELIPLPCEPKRDKEKGLAGKAAGKLKGDQSCWKYLGQEVEILGSAQSVMKKGKRIRRLGKIAGINPL
jgi:hypothetical protein